MAIVLERPDFGISFLKEEVEKELCSEDSVRRWPSFRFLLGMLQDRMNTLADQREWWLLFNRLFYLDAFRLDIKSLLEGEQFVTAIATQIGIPNPPESMKRPYMIIFPSILGSSQIISSYERMFSGEVSYEEPAIGESPMGSLDESIEPPERTLRVGWISLDEDPPEARTWTPPTLWQALLAIMVGYWWAETLPDVSDPDGRPSDHMHSGIFIRDGMRVSLAKSPDRYAIDTTIGSEGDLDTIRYWPEFKSLT